MDDYFWGGCWKLLSLTGQSTVNRQFGLRSRLNEAFHSDVCVVAVFRSERDRVASAASSSRRSQVAAVHGLADRARALVATLRRGLLRHEQVSARERAGASMGGVEIARRHSLRRSRRVCRGFSDRTLYEVGVFSALMHRRNARQSLVHPLRTAHRGCRPHPIRNDKSSNQSHFHTA